MMTDVKGKKGGASRPSRGRSAAEFLGEVKAELKRITWTTREELQVYTKIVLIGTIVMGLGIYLADLVVQGGLNIINLVLRWIGG